MNKYTLLNMIEVFFINPASGAVVGQVNATDLDQEGTDHVKLRFALRDGKDLFTIDHTTGVIKTITAKLDREVMEITSGK